MSNKLRNPFKMRASEKIESDANFLKLFSPDVIDILVERQKKGELWNDLLFIRSSPGAGKTSLLRVFESQSLNYIFNHKSQDFYKELYNPLKKLGVVDEEGIHLLGVILRCTRNYEILEDINIDEARKKRLFYALINSRIVLATLKGIAELRKDLQFPDDLEKIRFTPEVGQEDQIRGLKIPCNGQELFEWASSVEKDVYDVLDSFLPIENLKAVGHNEPFSTSILRPEYLSIDGVQIVDKILFMIDDAHKLSLKQRESYLKYLAENRNHSSIWISERLESLSDFRSFVNRDYNELNLEDIWHRNPGKFKKVLAKIASKRASISTEDVTSFQENLIDQIDETELAKDIRKSIEEVESNINSLHQYNSKFNNWYEYITEKKDHDLQTAILYKEAEILMHRNLQKNQLSFEFDLSVDELKSKIDSSLENAARLFISQKTKIPYYYGFDDLSSIATNNIDQFLSFSSELYEVMISKKLLGNEITVSPEKQDKIIRDIAKKKWNQLSALVPDSKLVKLFLDAMGRHFKSVTYKQTASYAPGINGFAINENSSYKLIEESKWQESEIYNVLRNMIMTCLTYNLLEVREVRQGLKGQVWQVYFLNRWLCIRYDLPLTYSGWNKFKPEQLMKWVNIK